MQIKLFKNIHRKIKEKIKDSRARYYISKIIKRKTNLNRKIRVGFIVFEPETWDKLQPVYEEFKTRDNIETVIVIVPSFDQEFRIIKKYGRELEYFKKIDILAIEACDKNGTWIDASKLNLDYVFYQDPYNDHIPKALNSNTFVKYSKICYIPYGFSGSDIFNAGNTNKDFFRNVYFAFLDTIEVEQILKEQFKNNVQLGYQHFIRIGYPALSKYAKETKSVVNYKKNIRNVLWTPRWSYDKILGGSHFLEYKDKFCNLVIKNKKIGYIFRPHPMMFKNLINNKMLTDFEKEDFLKILKDNLVIYSFRNDLSLDFKEADVLITDYSSIIPLFFLTKKPIIYCKSSIPLNSFYSELEKGMYVANSWEDVEKYLFTLYSDGDYLYSTREKIIKNILLENKDSEIRIVNTIIADFTSN